MSKGPDAFRTISEVAEDLNLPQHVLRFWETRFAQIKPLKRGGGRRYYRPDDVDLLRGIRQLLYGEGYTIKGVQRILREQGQRFVISAGKGEVDGVMAAGRGAAADTDVDDETETGMGIHAMAEHDLSGGEDDDIEVRPNEMREHTGASSVRLVEGFVSGVHPSGNGNRPALVGDDVHELRATLAELLECKRLLDHTR